MDKMGDVELGLDTLNIFLLLLFFREENLVRTRRGRTRRSEREREREKEKGLVKEERETCPRLLRLFLLLLREVSSRSRALESSKTTRP